MLRAADVLFWRRSEHFIIDVCQTVFCRKFVSYERGLIILTVLARRNAVAATRKDDPRTTQGVQI